MGVVVKDLIVGRFGVPCCAPVSFHMRPGNCMIITGPNGSGKTSFLKTCAGLIRPLHGTVLLDNIPLTFQDFYYGGVETSSHLTVKQHSDFLCNLYGGSMDALSDSPWMHNQTSWEQRICDLSSGERQRLYLALLSLFPPRPLWLLDEPLHHIDLAGENLFYTQLADHLNHGGMAIIATPQPYDCLQNATIHYLETP